MYLKALEIKGFKSFMDKTYISFPKGMISIVGPNGSGKSNILDAIRWVLGEQSIKSLRGDKLEDVIFSGTQKRSPMGYCEVTLILDNTDKTAEIEYSELSIKRKAYKSGESQFFLNGKRCRLKDIKELLLDTGIGKEGYSIISQGKIDEIISSNSFQKRALLEEASGITKFRYKKVESEKNLEQSNENLERIKDIFTEIEKQIKPLEIQKEKAEKYISLSEKLKLQEINKNLRTKDKIDSEISGLREKLESSKKTERENLENIEKKEKNIGQKEQDLETVSINRQEMYEKKSQAQKMVSSNIKNQELREKEIQNLMSTNQLLLEQFNDSKKQMEDTSTSLKLLKEELVEKNTERDNIQNTLDELKKQQEDISEKIEKNEILAGEKIQKTRSLENETVNLEARIDFQNENMKSFADQFEEYEREEKEISLKIDQINSEISQKEAQIRDENTVLEEINKKLSENAAKSENLSKKLFDINELISKNNLRLKDISAKTQMLENFENDMQAFSKGTKSILKDKSLSGIENVVANVIKVKKGYEKAIEQLLGGRLENIIIKEAKDAKAAIDKLKKDRLGRATFLPMDTIKPSFMDYSDEGVKAIDVVEYENKYSDIISNLLGRMVIVEDMDSALHISKKYKNSFRIATKTGEIFNVGGSITGGSSNYSKEIFTRRSTIEENKKIINNIISSLKDMQEESEKIKKDISCLKGENEKLLYDLNCQREKTEESKRRYFALSTKKESVDEKMQNLTEEKDQVVKANEMAAKSYKKDCETLQDMKEKIKQMNIETEEIQNLLKEQRENLSKISENLGKTVTKYSLLQQDIKNVEEKINDINQIINLSSKKFEAAGEKIEINKQKINFNEKEIERLKLELVDFEKKLEDIENSFKEIDKKESEFSSEIKKLKEELEILNSKQNSCMEEKLKLEANIENISYKLKLTEENLIQTYMVDFENAEKFRDDSLEVDKNTIKTIKDSINALGNVNIDAIEEFKNVNERYLFYKEQKEDLEESIAKIGSIIKKLEKTMVENFKESFRIINSNFKDIFKVLFGGGSAKLVLTDENNVLESDIEISVHPPGKKLRTISMLSGGEKALCAIALLFAIIAKKPVPFCILDEIDAPLDDANIYRYIGYLSTLSDTTQFITITHRRGTMEESDYIYGITMQEKGVSKVVSLKLEDAKDYVED